MGWFVLIGSHAVHKDSGDHIVALLKPAIAICWMFCFNLLDDNLLFVRR